MAMMTINNSILECELNYILDDKNEPWFNGKCVGIALGYKNTMKSLIDHVDDDDKEKLGNFKHNDSLPLKGNLKNSIYITNRGYMH